jgi:hypothetical protein
LLLDGKEFQKSIDFGLRKLLRVALSMMEDETPNPVHVRFLCAPAVMAAADCGSHPI